MLRKKPKLTKKSRRLKRQVQLAILAFGLLVCIGYLSLPDSWVKPEERRRLGDPALEIEVRRYQMIPFSKEFFTDSTLKGAHIFHILGMFYMFIAIALVCDEFFVPALEVIVDTVGMSEDVAGATFMAAGGSAPELFTSFIGVFISKSNVGFGTIVGSAVFNVLFVIGCCAIFSSGELKLTWWPFARDVCYYIFALVMLVMFFGVNTASTIETWEAVVLFSLYFVYVFLMWNNERLHKWVLTKVLKKGAGKDARLAPNAHVTRLNFRVGIHSLFKNLNKEASFVDIVGAYLVEKIAGSVEKTFNKIDIDKSGFLEPDEIKQALRSLGEADEGTIDEDVENLLRRADENNDKKISLEEFKSWYMSAKSSTKKRVDTIFDKYDTDHNGFIDDDEFRDMLGAVQGKPPSKDLLDAAIKDMDDCGREDAERGISKEEFKVWYNRTMFENRYKGPGLERNNTLTLNQAGNLTVDDDNKEPPEEANDPMDLSWPEPEEQVDEDGNVVMDENGQPKMTNPTLAKIWWLVTIPIVLTLWMTLYDVRNPKYRKFFPQTFIFSIVWLAVFSYFMVWWATTIGWVWGFPSELMGLTFIAAGTSVPDLFTSVIVARQGFGDMAVSSSIGSNIFDVLVGLPLPWIVKTVSDGEPLEVGANDLVKSILVLLFMLMVVFAAIVHANWVLSKRLGYAMFLLYLIYLIFDLTWAFAS